MNSNKKHSLWVERYRPDTLQNYLGSTILKASLEKYIRKQDLPSFVMYGLPGVGKTTAAKILCKNINCDYLHLNASDDNGIETVRTKIKNFASTRSIKPIKIVVMDDAYNLTMDAQQALLNMIEEYSKTTRFIFTTNHIEKLIPALRSRLNIQFEVCTPTKKEVKIHLATILSQEEVAFDAKDITAIVDRYYPDIRSCVSILQNNVDDNNELTLDLSKNVNMTYLESVVELLKNAKSNKETWANIRQILLDAEITDYTNLFKHLYNEAENFAKKNYDEVIFAISKAQYQQYFVPDREINVAEMILTIINAIK